MNDSVQEKFDKLISGFDTAMLVTLSLDGKPRARPMAIAKHDKGGLLYFTTRSDDEKLEEILEENEVAVTMQTEGRYLSITGKARIETDLQVAERLWSPAMKLWFPEGLDDPALTVILIEPECGEYWDRTNLLRLEFLWEAGKALVKGEQVSDEELTGHEKIPLDEH